MAQQEEQQEQQEQQEKHLLPSRLVMRVDQCDYCFATDNIHTFSIPGDHLTGLMSCTECSERALKDLKAFVVAKGNFVVNKSFFAKLNELGISGSTPVDWNKFGFFKVLRSNGDVQPGWQFFIYSELCMPAVKIKGEQCLYAKILFDDDDVPSVEKYVSVKSLCQVNGWNEEVFLKALHENTDCYFRL